MYRTMTIEEIQRLLHSTETSRIERTESTTNMDNQCQYYRNPIIAQALKILGHVNLFNRGIRRVKRLMLDNGGPEPRFDITKITAFEVTSYSALEMFDNQGKNGDI